MRLSQVIHQLNLLQSNMPLSRQAILQGSLGTIKNIIDTSVVDIGEHAHRHQQKFDQIEQAISEYEVELQAIIGYLQNQVENLTPEYFTQCMSAYDLVNTENNHKEVLNRVLVLNEQMTEFVRARIQPYANWKFPGLIIRPGQESWVTNCVGLDPLYLVDIHKELLQPALERFPVGYQRRLRPYVIQEKLFNNMFDLLPAGQIGYCLIYNFFNFKPLQLMLNYLKQIYALLRPGGVLAFTFNDCDRYGGVRSVEMGCLNFCPWTMLHSLCQEIGYEIHRKEDLNESLSWVEMSKPGTLHTVKAAQAFAKIIYKNQ